MMPLQCFFFFLIFFINAYLLGTQLNGIDNQIPIGTHNICLYKNIDKKYTGCNLKTMVLLDCVCIRVRAVNRSNMVGKFVRI